MPDDAAAPQAPITIPDAVRAQFPDLVQLILASESMNDDERRYWLQLLLVMTPEQVGKLREILVSEREQLTAIDAKYGRSGPATPTPLPK